ncbi:molecular chaperone TorD family protein [uncultured Roseibium sp.]|uniref:TorD/DmsD family molecular chaperone n=1 Tax=uncultured Roseibium sp. TaxID=1936171 RepID=UPI0032167C48
MNVALNFAPLADRDADPDLALVADWLALQFLTAPDAARIRAGRSTEGQAALRQIGVILGRKDVSDALCRQLADGTVTDVTVGLQRRHTALFEGIFRRRGLPPYASVWDGTGRLYGPAVGRMQELLRGLDLHLDETCCEPPDHIAIQLAALAEALRQGRTGLVPALLDELRWVVGFAASLTAVDDNGYYGAVAQLLSAFVEKAEQN